MSTKAATGPCYNAVHSFFAPRGRVWASLLYSCSPRLWLDNLATRLKSMKGARAEQFAGKQLIVIVIWHLSCKLKARNFDSGLSQLSSCHVMSCGDRKSFRPSSGCCLLNFISPLQARESHSIDTLMGTVLWSSISEG